LLASGLVAGEALMALILTGVKAGRPGHDNELPNWSLGHLISPDLNWVAHVLAGLVFFFLMWYMISMPLRGHGRRE
jgi:hypothetical protein